MHYPWHQTHQQRLIELQQQERLPHALLFDALSGCGHEHFVQELAHSLLCRQPDEQGNACCHCRSCQVFQSGAHPDFLAVHPLENKQDISIQQIRAVTEFLTLSRSYSSCRVALILQAERMTLNAANSLLKSLEEPVGHTYLLLYSTQANQLLATIRSRCQTIRLPLPNTAQSIAWLQTQATRQNADFLLQQSLGKPLWAQALDSDDTLEKQRAFRQALFNLALGKETITALSLQWEKESAAFLLDCQLQWLYQLASESLQSTTVDAENTGTDKKSARTEPMPISTPENLENIMSLWSVYDRLLALKQLATHPLNPRLFVENMLVLWPKSLLIQLTQTHDSHSVRLTNK